MPIELACPKCRRVLGALREPVPLEARCPDCSTVFPVARAGVPVHPEVGAEGRRPGMPSPGAPDSAGAELAPEWQEFHRGLGLFRTGLYVGLLGTLAAGGLVLFQVVGRSRSLLEGAEPQAIDWTGETLIYILAGLAAFILVVAGRFACCWVPERTHARGLARGAAYATVLAPLFLEAGWCGSLLPVVENPFRPVAALLGAAGFLGTVVTAEVLFLMFLRQVGLFLGSRELTRGVWWLLALFGFLLLVAAGVTLIIAASLLLAVGPAPAPRGPAEAPVVVSAVGTMVVFGIIVLAYAVLIGTARDAIISRCPLD